MERGPLVFDAVAHGVASSNRLACQSKTGRRCGGLGHAPERHADPGLRVPGLGQQRFNVERMARGLGLAQVEREPEACLAGFSRDVDQPRSIEGLQMLEGLEWSIRPGAAHAAHPVEGCAQRDAKAQAMPLGQLRWRQGAFEGLAPQPEVVFGADLPVPELQIAINRARGPVLAEEADQPPAGEAGQCTVRIPQDPGPSRPVVVRIFPGDRHEKRLAGGGRIRWQGDCHAGAFNLRPPVGCLEHLCLHVNSPVKGRAGVGPEDPGDSPTAWPPQGWREMKKPPTCSHGGLADGEGGLGSLGIPLSAGLSLRWRRIP